MKEEMRRSKKIFYTQRVEIVESYHERRDCADQNIPRLLQACGYLPFPIPNVIDDIAAYLEAGRPDGILLTGGNSLICYGGNAAERDRTDAHVLQWAIEKRIPVYGFCRGMQSILDFFGVKLRQVENHVALRHNVSGEWGTRNVNSYHNQAALQVCPELIVTAVSEDRVIEALRHKEYPIEATMWHPEREQPFAKEDIRRLQDLFG